MRLALAKYLNINESEILKTEKYPYIKKLIPQEYIYASDKSQIISNAYKKEKITNMDIEADLSLIGLSALLFNVNIDLNILEGFSKDIKNFSSLKFFKKIFPCKLEDPSTKKICLFFRNSRWSIGYRNSIINPIKNFFIENNLLNTERIEEKFNTIDFECEKCRHFNNLSKILYIKKYKKYCFCINCLKKHIEKTIEVRKNFFQMADLLDKECNLNI